MSRVEKIIYSFLGTSTAIVVLVVLILVANHLGNAKAVTAVSLFGAIIVLMHLTHLITTAIPTFDTEHIIDKFDRVFLYLLVASSYIPLYLIVLPKGWGWSLFGVSMAILVLGIIFRLSKKDFLIKFGIFLFYVLDWLVVLAFFPIHEILHIDTIKLLTLGGLFYTFAMIVERRILEFKKVPALHYPYFWLLMGHVAHASFIVSYFAKM